MLLAISLETACSRALLLLSLPLFPAVPDILTEPKPINPALASAVTEAFQPLSRDFYNLSAPLFAWLELSVFTMPTEKVNFCASVAVIPFQYPVAWPAFYFSILIDLAPPFKAAFVTF